MKTPGFRKLLFKKIAINELKYGLNGTKIEQSYPGMKNNQDLSVVLEVKNSDTDLNGDENKSNEEDYKITI